MKADDLEPIVELGRGAYGVVEKMRHVPSEQIMAVKRIRATVNSQEQKRLLMDLDISMRTVDCPFTVTFYGALFREVGGSPFKAARQAVTEKDVSRISQTPAVTGRFLVRLVFCREFHAREMLVQS